MIIDCDTHVIPPDAFDYLGEEFAALRPVFHFDDKGHYWHCDFPGRPEEVPGTTPLPGIRGAGTDFDGMCDMEARLEDFAKLGVDMQVIGPQFTAWWSYLIEPELATAMARSHKPGDAEDHEKLSGQVHWRGPRSSSERRRRDPRDGMGLQ
jgi:hypothetical protein